MLKIKFSKAKIIELKDWDDAVQEFYEKPYSFQQQDGCKGQGVYRFSVPSDDSPYDFENDTVEEKVNSREMGVSFEAWLKRDFTQPLKNETSEEREDPWAIELWWHRNFYPHIDMIVKDFYEKEILKKGDYIILIDW